MIVDKFLTRKGWRVVADSLLAAAGIGLLYFLTRMVIENINRGYTLGYSCLSVAIALSSSLASLSKNKSYSMYL